MVAGVSVARQVLAQEHGEVRGELGHGKALHAWACSALRAMWRSRTGVGLEVPVGGGDAVVTEIGRECQHMPVRAVAVGGNGVFERADGEAMTEVVQPRSRLAGAATKPRLGVQA